MRRSIILAVGALVAALLPAPLPVPSTSADTTVVVRGLQFPSTATYTIGYVGCAAAFDVQSEPWPEPVIGPDPAPAPLGESSVRYDLSPVGNAIGAWMAVQSLSSTAVAGLWLHTATDASGVANVIFQDATQTSSEWVGRAALSAAARGWRFVEVSGLSYTWSTYDLNTGVTTPGGGDHTVPAFLDLQGGDAEGVFTIGFGCDGEPFSMDAWQIGSPGDVTTVDLERDTTTTTISAECTICTAGQDVRVAGTLRGSDGHRYEGAPLVLEAKRYGSATFRVIATRHTSPDGGGDAHFTVNPYRRTVYRWRYLTNDIADGSVSAPLTIMVRTRVWARLSSSKVRVGHRLVVTGRTTPAKPGNRVTLWRTSRSGPVRLVDRTVRDDGSYRLAVRPRKRGSWTVYVTVAPGSGNLAGRSPSHDVKIVR